MFTGLIEAVGSVVETSRTAGGFRLRIQARWPDDEDPRKGDSVAVNGACLTAVEPEPGAFSADLSPETLSRTRLSSLRPGDAVNLERALRAGGRLGGHFVQGHVDAVVRILSISNAGSFARWRISLPTAQSREVAVKGSVALDGVSLTVAALGDGWFEVALIPATLEATALGRRRPGDALHLETDVLAKYVARSIEKGASAGPSVWEVFLDRGSNEAD
ncbi:MAG: riboflavin synthase [Acidobacteria bacterium]|nr:riboflavin synthase [Acidobacteriota bacterium]